MPRPWRQEIELLQNYPKHKTFTYTTTSANAEDAVVLAGNMEVKLIMVPLYLVKKLLRIVMLEHIMVK